MASHLTKSHPKFLRHSAVGASRFWLTCLLCLCAWRGPIPIVHTHSFESQVLAGNVLLAVHAASHHAHDIDHGGGGWHVHFVLPSSGSDDLPLGNDADSPNLAWPTALLEDCGDWSVCDVALEVATAWELADAQLVRWDVALNPAPLARPPIEPKRISPHAWLCIARC